MDMPQDLFQKVNKVCSLFEKAVEKEVQRRSLVRAIFPALFPCNILCVVDKANAHVVFSNINAGGLPTQKWLDRRNDGPFAPSDIVQAAVTQHGIIQPSTLSVGLGTLDWPEEQQQKFLADFGTQYVEQLLKMATRPRAVPGYEGLQPWLDQFSDENTHFEKNVLIMMRFRNGKQFEEIHEAIKSGLSRYGLKGLRVDDRVYPSDGDLFNNVCVYMMGCKYGVGVFEEIDEREFNPNVPLEYGFMRAMNRQVLLLKDQRMPKMPSDMTGKLYRHFDTYNITGTIHEQISQWAERDLGLKL